MSYQDIDGTPYLNEEFQTGEIYFKEKYMIPNVPLRFNLYLDEFEYKNKDVILALDKPESIEKIVVGEEVFTYIKEEKQNDISGFVRIWNSTYPAAVSKYKVEFLRATKPKPYEEPKPDRFQRSNDKHFLMVKEHMVFKITSVKKVIKSLGNHEEELTAFAKKEKISSGDPEELSKLLEYYHSLNEQVQ